MTPPKKENQAKPAVVVQKRLSNPHPLVANARDVLNKSKADSNGILYARAARILSIHVGRDCLPRALRIMDAVLKACENEGWKVEVVGGDKRSTTVIWIDGESEKISIHEQLVRVPHVYTRQELEDKKRYPSLYSSQRYDFELTGELYLSIENGYAPGVQARYADGKRKRLEEQIASFISSLRANADYYIEYRRNYELERRRRQEQRALEEAAEQIRQEERKALDELEAQAARWQRSRVLRDFVAAVVSAAGDEATGLNSPGFHAWCRWALRYADQLDPVDETLSRYRLPPS